jgi:hypothetical protein
MAVAHAWPTRRVWPIVYDRRTRRAREGGTRGAWALFLGLGLPFLLMAVLTVLAHAGTTVALFRPLWQPWPPDLLKPVLGLAVFAATLAHLAYRIGRRAGFRAGTRAVLVPLRTPRENASRWNVPPATPPLGTRPDARPLPPPPPPDDAPEPSN